MNDENLRWIEKNKDAVPFAAGALAALLGHSWIYGCHYGLRSEREWCAYQYKEGWLEATRDLYACEP